MRPGSAAATGVSPFAPTANGMGFHSPQESTRILGSSANQAQQARLLVSRLLARQQVAAEPLYPDVSTREKATAVVQAFQEGKGANLLP